MSRQTVLFEGADDTVYRVYQEERARVVPGARLIKLPPTTTQRQLIIGALREFPSADEGRDVLVAIMVGTYADHPEPRLVSIEAVLKNRHLWQLRAEKGAAVLAERAAPAEPAMAENRENVRRLFGVK